MELRTRGALHPVSFSVVLAGYQVIDENNDRVGIKITRP